MIATKNVSYQYPGGKKLTFPDFSLGRGDQCLLLGESGSGKTTLLHLLGGLLRAQSGSILIAGTDITQLSETQLDSFRGKTSGYIFQRNHLIQALDVKNNLMLSSYLAGLPQDHLEVKNILGRLGIGDLVHAKITRLSQGQLQRVAIARAVLNKPGVIFADEPTSALDDKSCDRVIGLLTDVARDAGSALVIATHDQRLKNRISNHIVITDKIPLQ